MVKKTKLSIKFTRHAKNKIEQRNISKNDIKEIVTAPGWIEKDRFDNTLSHLIGFIDNKYLRVIGRWENNLEFLVVSAFFDRRLRRRKKR